ncbi:MAG: hypothetical protein R3B40_27305 [Polyangiales bacterium]|nr:hypothetical protein [Myxococcales bacterium]MCB9657136.1 hypothetical protein [Sandaracinaceae bacterium]
MRHLLYPLFGATVIAVYTYTATMGVDPFASSTEHRTMPPEVRAAPSGPGAAVFWYGGLHGGK